MLSPRPQWFSGNATIVVQIIMTFKLISYEKTVLVLDEVSANSMKTLAKIELALTSFETKTVFLYQGTSQDT